MIAKYPIFRQSPNIYMLLFNIFDISFDFLELIKHIL